VISVPDQIMIWQMPDSSILDNATQETNTKLLELAQPPVPELKAGEVLVEIAGCSVSQTFNSKWHTVTATANNGSFPPIHGISGRVVAGDQAWIGQDVLVPPSIPCGECRKCQAGRVNHCLSPKPIFDVFHNGFASHVPLSTEYLYAINERKRTPLENLSAIPLSVAPLFQAAQCASLNAGDNVIVIGENGSTISMVHMAKALGAGNIIAVDSVEDGFQKILSYGADLTVNINGNSPAKVYEDVKNIRKQKELPQSAWKIFNVSGNDAGKETALRLTGDTDMLILVGCSEEEAESAKQNHTPSDATIIGTQGCLPEFYPQVMDMVISRRFIIGPFVLTRPMSWIREFFMELPKSPGDILLVLTTDDFGLDYTWEPKSCR